MNIRIAPRASALTITADPTLDDAYSVSWDGPAPRVRERDGAIEIDYTVPARLQAMSPRRRSLALALNPGVDWELELEGGVSRLRADLRELRLSALDVDGGASDVTVDLPRPAGKLPLRIKGGASGLVVRRPAAVPVSVEIDGGATGLRLDESELGAIGGTVRQRTPGASNGGGEVALHILGGASDVTVDANEEVR
jgi:hypothetical protein